MKTSKFQLGLLAIFVIFIAGGLLFFSAFKGNPQSEAPTLLVWGTLPSAAVNNYLGVTVNKAESPAFSQVTYIQKRPETMYQQYVEALISGTGPDILLMPQEEILKYRGKLTTIPYANYPENDYKNSFIQEGELYLGSDGIQAIPFTVDPMVMYWNRDIFSNALIATPPKTWEEFLSLAPTLTKRDNATNIVRSAVGLGEYNNVTHAKEILSMLFMQAGTPITARYGNKVQSQLVGTQEGVVSAGEQTLLFFTQFADPIKKVYSWNRSLPATKTYFTSNRLGIYFGFASEFRELKALNPNLNFDVAVVPQITAKTTTTPINITYGKMYGLSLARTQKSGAALAAIYFMTSSATLPTWVKQSGYASVRKDALAIDASSAESSVFAISALWSRGWIDPDKAQTATIFKNMIEGVTSGRNTPQEAIYDANSQLQNILNRMQ
ncbi:MAG: extracellular solute-binding protein [bacterium]|nr:extracellular solute-binding protein [bacterium]